MKLKKVFPTLILLAMLAMTFVVAPVFSEDPPAIPPPDEELYLNEFNGVCEWNGPPENVLGPPDGLYIEGDTHGQRAFFYGFENIDLAGREIAHIYLEGYTRFPNGANEGVDIDVYGRSEAHPVIWLGGLWGTSSWDWHGVRWVSNDVLEHMPELAGQTELNNLQIYIYNWYGDAPDVVQLDSVKLKVCMHAVPPVEDTDAYIEYVNETIQDLPDEIFNRPEEDISVVKNDFSVLLNDTMENINEGNYEGAIVKLNRIKVEIYEEMVESAEREEIISLIDELIAYVESLL